jgi:5S rRNA maturation endonuclease (ribonuclease M5)
MLQFNPFSITTDSKKRSDIEKGSRIYLVDGANDKTKVKQYLVDAEIKMIRHQVNSQYSQL